MSLLRYRSESAPIATQHTGTLRPPSATFPSVQDGAGGTCAGGVLAVGHLEVFVGPLEVADEVQAVDTYDDGGVSTDISSSVQGGPVRSLAGIPLVLLCYNRSSRFWRLLESSVSLSSPCSSCGHWRRSGPTGSLVHDKASRIAAAMSVRSKGVLIRFIMACGAR